MFVVTSNKLTKREFAMTLVCGPMHCRVRTWLGDIARLKVERHSSSMVRLQWVTAPSFAKAPSKRAKSIMM
jgi:hypothetical protein